MKTIHLALSLALTISPALAAEFMIIGIDTKIDLKPTGIHKVKPGHDAVLVYEISENPEKPREVARLFMPNSIFGPPTNLLVTPDAKLALVANSVNWVEVDGEWTAVPDTKIDVINLGEGKVKTLDQVDVGAQPSGMGISADGKTVVVANRKGRSVSLLGIEGVKVTVLDTIEIDGEAAAVAVAPDGSRALVTKFAEHSVAVLSITEGKLSYDDANDIAVGRWPYNVQMTPNGALALVANNGNNGFPDGHADTVSVIDLESDPPRAIDHVTVGDGPEGLAISPDGTLAAVPLLQGSAPPFEGKWFHNKSGAIALLRIDGKTVKKIGTVETGAFPEGIGFSKDGRYLYCGDLAAKQLSVFKIQGDSVKRVNTLKLPHYPASLRTQVP